MRGERPRPVSLDGRRPRARSRALRREPALVPDRGRGGDRRRGASATCGPTTWPRRTTAIPFVVYLMRGAEMWRLAAQVLRQGGRLQQGPLGAVQRAVRARTSCRGSRATWARRSGWRPAPRSRSRTRASDRVCVCAFGDGTANRGDFHENVNLAACWRLPIVYVCQNNGWAISQPADSYLPAPIVDRAAGYGIPGVAVDGNDVEAVRAVVAEAVARARRGDGPDADRGADLAPARPLGRRCGNRIATASRPRPCEIRWTCPATACWRAARPTLADLEQIAIDAEVEVAAARLGARQGAARGRRSPSWAWRRCSRDGLGPADDPGDAPPHPDRGDRRGDRAGDAARRARLLHRAGRGRVRRLDAGRARAL